MKHIMSLLALISLSLFSVAHATDFFCPSGNVTCLIAAINEANQNGEDNTINLEAGNYDLETVVSEVDGANGLPSITGRMTIQGPEGDFATIRRTAASLFFNICHVGSSGVLNLYRVILHRGIYGLVNRGITTFDTGGFWANDGAAWNPAGGILTIRNSDITEHGFLSTIDNQGDLRIERSFIYRNGDKMIAVGDGQAQIVDSVIYDNFVGRSGHALIDGNGRLAIISSTLTRNTAAARSVFIAGTNLINSTIVDNFGLSTRGTVRNSIIADSSCLQSLGHNIFRVCTPIGTDIVADPRLGSFTDDRYYPLLPDSPAIDSANPDACPERDQIGNPRVGICDRGSIEFQGGEGAPEGELLASNPAHPED